MNPGEIDAWARAYIEAQVRGSSRDDTDPLWPYVLRLMPNSSDWVGPDNAWSIILAVLALQPGAEVTGVLAAGPLEDLIHYHGIEYIERIEAEARQNPAFRHLLGGVWQSGPKDVWERIEVARRGIVW